MKREAKTIAALNDAFRSSGRGGRIMLTQGVNALGPLDVLQVMGKVRTFSTFTPDNDPHGEHDFGAFDHGGHELFWKIDYYDPTLTYGAEDPADVSRTVRVLTVLLAAES